jgi:beta-glucosidase
MCLLILIKLCLCTFFVVEVEECTFPQVAPFRNVSLPWNIRVQDLVSRLTVEEVVLQLSKGGAGKNGGPAPSIPQLGIDPYQWNTECLRGDVEAGNATSFPEAIGLAASFRYG